MNILVLTSHYPDLNGGRDRMFVHVRNKYYKKQGIETTVLNFHCAGGYDIEGIPVISLQEYKERYAGKKVFDLAVVHSANLRNHYLFLKRYEKDFQKFVFFFHGQEVLYFDKDYPKPYSYLKSGNACIRIMRHMYDWLKIHVWKDYYIRLIRKSQYVFVSSWLKDRFLSNAQIKEEMLSGHCHIIHNGVGEFFEKNTYQREEEKKYDYICIRENLDGSKYCVDLFTRIAEKYPEKKFLLIGKGSYFKYNQIPDNLEWKDQILSHDEIGKWLNMCRYGFMLTREDTQGVMTCEMAAYGIPVITSDIEVCREIFRHSPNVVLVRNDPDRIDLNDMERNKKKLMNYTKDTSYFADKTVLKEVELLKYMESLRVQDL